MPQQNKITVHFKASGEKDLLKALKAIAKAQKDLNKQVKQASVVSEKHRLRVEKNTETLRKNNTLVNRAKAGLAQYRNTLLLAAFGIAAFSKTVGKLTALYAEQEAAEKRLSTALGFTSQRLLDFASAQQKITAFGDEVTISAMSQAAAFTTNQAAIEQMTVAAQNLAAGRGMDLKTSMDLIAKSVFSSTNALTRYGITVRGGLGTLGKFNAIMEKINEQYGGQAAAQADTYAGAVQQMKNAWGDFGEAGGQVLAEALLPLVKTLTSLAQALAKLPLGFIAKAVTALGVSLLVTDARLKAFGATVVLTSRRLRTGAKWMATYRGAAIASGAATTFLATAGRALLRVFAVGAIIELTTRLAGALFGGKDNLTDAAERSAEQVTELEGAIENFAIELAKLQTISQLQEAIEGLGIKGLEEDISLMKEGKLAVIGLANAIDTKLAPIKPPEGLEFLKDFDINLLDRTKHITEFAASSERATKALEGQAAAVKEMDIEAIVIKERELNRLKTQRIALEEKINKIELDNAIWAASQVPLLQNEIDQLELKNTFSGAELEIKLKLLEAGLREAKLTPKQIEDIKILINKKHELNNVMKQEEFLVNSFNSAMLQGINNNGRFAESFGNMIKKMAAQMAAHMATFVLFNALTGGTFGAGSTALKYGIAKMTGGTFHEGGLVGGEGKNVPAVLQGGEFVMNRSAVESIGVENLNKMNQGGSASVTVNFSGNVLSQSFIEDEAIPQIKEAIRRGADIGVS